ncbi:MAG: GspE/PulE family protein [Desulforegulaceae bacterium]|nr:GspE/PulE family protein [Desulforegulaceae bacterium]
MLKSLKSDLFGEFLISENIITRENLARLLSVQKAVPEKIGILAAREGLATEEAVLNAFSKYSKIPVYEGDTDNISPELIKIIPEKMARKANVVPVERGKNNELLLACTGSVPKGIMQNFSRIAKTKVSLVLVSDFTLKKMQQAAYAKNYDTSISFKTEKTAEEAPEKIIEVVEKIILRAVTEGASDIHFEPGADEFCVRFRKDGLLFRTQSLPSSYSNKIISRIKVLSDLDIAEKRMPQDGSFVFMPEILDIRIDAVNLRVSILPVVYGEKAVLRILPPHDEAVPLENIGMKDDILKNFKKLLSLPHGIVLVTGPTGSGKSTTLYGSLNVIRNETLNITTLEDPVELTMRGINQTHISGSEKISFASGLRSILRQDPDVIMVGEIRDSDTLQVSLRASITGHLVLSTLHTNDAPSTFGRLLDMGAEPFLTAASVRGILAQRLVRLSCPFCSVEEPVTKEELSMLKLSNINDDFRVKRGKGCLKCRNKGYLGRIGLFELLMVDEKIKQLILKGADSSKISEAGFENGYKTLAMDGIDKVRKGLTTPEEVLRVTMEG